MRQGAHLPQDSCMVRSRWRRAASRRLAWGENTQKPRPLTKDRMGLRFVEDPEVLKPRRLADLEDVLAPVVQNRSVPDSVDDSSHVSVL